MRIKCDGAKCFITEIERLASGAINYFTAKFNFDNAWAIFIDANQLYGVFEGSDMVVISNLAYNAETQTYDCEIPWQVITQEGELHVGAIGHITTPETIILTTNMAFAYRVPKGAATTGNEISDPSGLLLNILEASGVIQENVDKTNAAISHWPIIDPTTQNWFRWDILIENYVDTGTSAVGEKGKDLVILGHYNTLSFLQSGVLSPVAGEIYSVGTTTPYTAYIYDGVTSAWISYGEIFGGSGGSSEGSVTQVDFDAHVDSLLMHKPAIECTAIGTASVEGYRNTAGYLGVYYETPFDVSNTVVATASPNEFIITFADTRPFAIVNEPIKLTLQSGMMLDDGIVIELGAQTITVQLTGDIFPEEGDTLQNIIFLTQPAPSYTHAEGDNTVAQGPSSHAEGSYTFVTSGDLYRIIGVDDTTKTITLEDADELVVGDLLQIKALSPSKNTENPLLLTNIAITAINENEVTLDTIESLIPEYTWAIKQDSSYGSSAHVEGYGGMVTGWSAHGEGRLTLAGGDISHAEGDKTVASEYASHAQGSLTIASGGCAHAEGVGTISRGYCAHAEGGETLASGPAAHAEGYHTQATSLGSHAEGTRTTASGQGSHAEGMGTIASGLGSHAQGIGTIAEGESQTAMGKYNKPDTTSLLIIGKGTNEYQPETSDYNKENAFVVESDGSVNIASGATYKINGVPISGSSSVGDTASRPTDKGIGFMFYDTTLSKPIWYTGTIWKDALGTTV